MWRVFGPSLCRVRVGTCVMDAFVERIEVKRGDKTEHKFAGYHQQQAVLQASIDQPRAAQCTAQVEPELHEPADVRGRIGVLLDDLAVHLLTTAADQGCC